MPSKFFDNPLTAQVACSELMTHGLTHTAQYILELAPLIESASRLGRMALLKSVETELLSARSHYLDLLLYAKRKLTGTGKAALAMELTHYGLVIAGTIATGPAAIGIVAAAAVTKGAATNQNVISTALEASAAAEAKKANQDINAGGAANSAAAVASGASTSDHTHWNNRVSAGISGAQLAASRLEAFRQQWQRLKHWYEYRVMTPPTGEGDWKLSELKRKHTAWLAHGERR